MTFLLGSLFRAAFLRGLFGWLLGSFLRSLLDRLLGSFLRGLLGCLFRRGLLRRFLGSSFLRRSRRFRRWSFRSYRLDLDVFFNDGDGFRFFFLFFLFFVFLFFKRIVVRAVSVVVHFVISATIERFVKHVLVLLMAPGSALT